MTGDPALHVEARLDRYVEEIQRLGRRLNLVGSLEAEDIRVHVSDSLAGSPALPAGARVVDLGSGAGFPGIPLAIARADVDFTLVEIRERRVHFLRHAVRACGLSCRVIRQKIESPSERFDIALARAVAAPAVVLRMAAPWLVAAGELWLWTRETDQSLGVPVLRSIEITSDRGRILCVAAAEIGSAIERGAL